MIQVYVNRGMWIAECECRHAVALAPCGEGVEGVDWPADTERLHCVCSRGVQAVQWPSQRAAIERVLVRRPVENRNWRPHETIADLRLENAAHHSELVA